MAFGVIADHVFGAAAGQPALYAVVAMGAVFASAARAPLTSVASVVELTGDFTLTLPVMLAVAIATAVSRALSYGTIYTTKLLRRGTDIDRAAAGGPVRGPHRRRRHAAPSRPRCRPPPPPLSGRPPGPAGRRCPDPSPTTATPRYCSPPSPSPRRCASSRSTATTDCRSCPPTGSTWTDGSPPTTCCTRSPRQLGPGRYRPGGARRRMGPSRSGGGPARAPRPAGRLPAPGDHHPPGSPAAGQTLGATPWPAGSIPVSVLNNGTIRDPDPATTLAPGDRINLLTPLPRHPQVP